MTWDICAILTVFTCKTRSELRRKVLIAMTEKELKKLSRGELLEMLLAEVRVNDALNERLATADEAKAKIIDDYEEKMLMLEEQLNERVIVKQESGSIAEAALKINRVFEAAEAAAKQYLDSMKATGEQSEEIKRAADQYSEDIRAEAYEYSETVRNEADAYSRNVRSQAMIDANIRLNDAKKEADRIINESKVAADAYWKEAAEKLQRFYDEHLGLRELMNVISMRASAAASSTAANAPQSSAQDDADAADGGTDVPAETVGTDAAIGADTDTEDNN